MISQACCSQFGAQLSLETIFYRCTCRTTRRPCRTPDGNSHPELGPVSCISPALYSRTTAYPDSDTRQSLYSPRLLRLSFLSAGAVRAQYFLAWRAWLG